MEIISKSQRYIVKDKTRYGFLAAFFAVLFVASFLPPAIVASTGSKRYIVTLDVALFLPRFLATITFVFFSLMASVFHRKEKNALASAQKSMQLILDQDGPTERAEQQPVCSLGLPKN
jgi:hypothetical protein